MRDEHRILSQPVRLNWLGWETDTLRLQQAGWRLSAQQDISWGRMRIAMEHEHAHMGGITGGVDFDYQRVMYGQYEARDYLRSIVLPVNLMGSQRDGPRARTDGYELRGHRRHAAVRDDDHQDAG
jgi:hypothetical protein